MPTPSHTYSPAAAEKLRRALLALAASAATTGCDLSSSDPCSGRTLGVPPPPLSSDSDGDGLFDEDEIRRYGTDPLNPDSDGIILGGEPPVEPATAPIVPGESPAIAIPDVLVRGEPPMMPVPSTNAPAAAPIPIEFTEEDRKKLESAGFNGSADTNAAARP